MMEALRALGKKNRGVTAELDTGWKPVPPKIGLRNPQCNNNGILGGTGFQPVFACTTSGAIVMEESLAAGDYLTISKENV
ncbi:MAG TPA: hypothetical protein VN641_07760, partial [Urbifossiella sp.]|nr:hypothetical protein [Urbifossiella sp.]